MIKTLLLVVTALIGTLFLAWVFQRRQKKRIDLDIDLDRFMKGKKDRETRERK